ncbi:hypothetical protein [Desulfobulbus oligotrophicus]|jgi:hypothetical protein|uniref:Uncharacterized protein n=1 Tax=Desulfobulbus oligotrophicus TaxID=1909699 RepID=A0A7T5VE60_9BACT|nr:hypothetical protein [Desulfobulbus oligotrophicus]MDY0391338.1 hypothetical protein [Desulfobulbus oligotrophicus]QQG66121.1 hypothetical protein HP555_09675 [Desulfobulbus oligotrophicus]
MQIERVTMGTNKGKLRRERKKTARERMQQQEKQPDEGRPIKPWVLRLIMMVPPVLYACYLVWDMSRQ